MRARDQSSIFSTGRKFCPDYGLLLELHALNSSRLFLCTLGMRQHGYEATLGYGTAWVWGYNFSFLKFHSREVLALQKFLLNVNFWVLPLSFSEYGCWVNFLWQRLLTSWNALVRVPNALASPSRNTACRGEWTNWVCKLSDCGKAATKSIGLFRVSTLLSILMGWWVGGECKLCLYRLKHASDSFFDMRSSV